MRIEQRLRSNERGAIMCIALFMCVFLAGALWYMVGVGDMIVERERLQESADAVAFSSAVIHARGMNAIAMMNVIMAALMAVLMAVKTAQLLLIITAAVAAALLAASQGSCTICREVLEASIEGIQKTEDVLHGIERPLLNGVESLSTAQKAVARTTPWLGQAEAKTLERFYADPKSSKHYDAAPIEIAASASPSMIPRDGGPVTLGLPVEDDEVMRLCERAGRVLPPYAWLPVDILLGPSKAAKVKGFVPGINGLIPGLIKASGGYYCGSGGGDVGQTVNAVGTKSVKDACGGGGRCEGRGMNALGDVMKDTAKLTSLVNGLGGPASRAPKKVSAGTKNGSGDFQVWGIAIGGRAQLATAPKIVHLATFGRKEPEPLPALATLAFGTAEFYFDCKGSWDSRDCNDEEGAMWDLRWRARLRTARFPQGSAGTALDTAVSQVVPRPAIALAMREQTAQQVFRRAFGESMDQELYAGMPPARTPDLVLRLQTTERVIAH